MHLDTPVCCCRSLKITLHLVVLFDPIFILYIFFSQHDLSEEGSSEGTAEPRWPTRSVGLTAQLQALRKALYHKYVQEVTTLKVQHSTELRRLREEGEQERKIEECQEAVLPKLEQDPSGVNASRLPAGSLWAGEQLVLEEKNWEKVEEEVAKVGVYGLRISITQRGHYTFLNLYFL